MTGQQTPSAALLEWLRAQLDAGHEEPAVLEAMQASGWTSAAAQDALKRVVGGEVASQPATGEHRAAHGQHGPDVPGGPHLIDLAGRQVKLLMAMDRPRVVVIEGLLSGDECDALIEGARGRLARSETVRDRDGVGEVHAARTSSGMFYGRGETPLIEALEARLARLLAWPVERGEGLQVLRYAPGAEYQAHHDFFDPQQPGSKAVLQRGGQRVGTVVMYLNTPTEGGATTFPEVGLQVQAVRGNAVFFAYPDATPASLTLHGGAPVLVGEKWVATKWLRQGEFR
jgi:prolyl 4-hydroxylase